MNSKIPRGILYIFYFIELEHNAFHIVRRTEGATKSNCFQYYSTDVLYKQ